MPDPQLPDLPPFEGYLPPRFNAPAPPSNIPFEGYLPPRFDTTPVPTGNLFSSALMSGLHGGLAEGARTLQAGAQLMGATDTAKSLSDIADEHYATAQSYARPDLEAAPWYSPSGLAYKLTQMVPTIGAVGLGTLAGAALAPEAAAGAGAAALASGIGAAAAAFPFAAGENVQRQVSETGKLTTPGEALALGVPEAALQAIMPARLEKYFGEGFKSLVAHSVAAQGIAAGGTEAMTQLMGDPNRGFVDRASDVVKSALGGAALGGVIGGAFGGMRALVGKPAADVAKDPNAMTAGIDPALKGTSATAPTPAAISDTLRNMATELGQNFPDRARFMAQTADAIDKGQFSSAIAQSPAASYALANQLERQGLGATAERYRIIADAASRVMARQGEAGPPQAPVPPAAAPVPPTVTAPAPPALPAPPAPPAPPASPVPAARQNLITTLQGMAAEAGGDRGAFIARLAGRAVDLGPVADQPPEVLRVMAARMEQGGQPGVANIYQTLADAAERLRTRGPELTQQPVPPAAAAAAPIITPPPVAPPAEPIITPPPTAAPVAEPAPAAPGGPPAVAAAPGEPVAPAAAAPAAPVIPIDITKSNFKTVADQYKNVSLDAQATMHKPLIEALLERQAEGKGPTQKLASWGKELGIMENGKLKPEVLADYYQRELRASMEEEGLPQDTRPLPSDAAVEAHEREVETPPVPVAPAADTVAADAITDHVNILKEAGTDEGKFKLALAAIMRDTDVKADQAAEIARQYTGDDKVSFKNKSAAVKAIQTEFKGRVDSQALREAAGRAALAVPTTVAPAAPLEEGIPEFLRRKAPPTPEAAAKQAAVRAGLLPVKNSEDRATALSNIAKQISELPPSPQKQQLVDELNSVNKKAELAETNKGYADTVNKNVMGLQAKIPQPPADAAVAANASSAKAQAVPAPTGNLDELIRAARDALPAVKRALGKDDPAIAQHEAWLANVTKADAPEDYAAVAKVHPEHPDVMTPSFGDMKQQPEAVVRYLNRYGELLQEVRALSRDPDSFARTVTSRDGLPVSRLDADLTNMSQRGVTLDKQVDHIAEHSADPEEAEIASWVKPYIPENIKTQFREGVTDKEGEYFPKDKLSVLYNAANATITTLHEAIHSVLHKALEGMSTAANAMRGIYDQLKDRGSHAGLANVHEMVSEMANPDFRAFLKSQYVRGTSLWDRFIDAARSVFGLPPRLFNAFERIMSHGDDLMREQQSYPNDAWLGPNSYARDSVNRMKDLSGIADQTRQLVRTQKASFLSSVNKFFLGFMRSEWIARDNAKIVKSAPEYIAAAEQYDPRAVSLAQGQRNTAYRAFEKLPEEGQQLVQRLMASTTDYEVDPRKPLDEHSSFTSEQDPAIRANVMNAYNEVAADWNALKQIKGGPEVFEAYRANGSAKIHMIMLNKLQTQERALQSADPNYNFVDKFKTFQQDAARHGSPQKTEEFFVNAVNDTRAAMDKYNKQQLVNQATADAALEAAKDSGASKEDIKSLTAQSASLAAQIIKTDAVIKDVTSQQKRVQEAPYFHLGRQGDYFGTGKFITDEDGNIDREKLTQFREFMNSKGFDDVAIMQYGGHDTFYSRVRTQAEVTELNRALLEAQKLGYLSKDSPIKAGLSAQVFPEIAPSAMRSAIEALKAIPLNIPVGVDQKTADAITAAHGNQMAELQRLMVNTQQENSVGRLLTRRTNTQGFSRDMIANQNFADENMGRGIARMSLMPEINAALAHMAEDVKTANEDPNISVKDRIDAANAVAELNLRERLRQTYVPQNSWDFLRSLTHTLHIGLSPAYFLMLQSQNLTTTLPELAKTHGYGAASKAMTTVLPQALAALKAITQSPDRLGAVVTYDALNGKVSDATRDILTGALSRGSLNAVFTKLMTEESPLHNNVIVKASNAIGLYSELIPRVIAALAADKLYSEKPYTDPRTGEVMSREDFIDNAIKKSQGDWGSNLGARQTSRYGFAGPLSPVMTQFMGWQLHMTTNIYNNIRELFDAKTRPEATSWLLGHSAATAMLAGTLGLPFVSVMASVYDKLLDWVTNRDDHDITGSYRNFLASTFGKDMGEVIARGAPRAAGMDFAHWGEGTIFPGSSLINTMFEKRKLEDIERDWAKGMAGPGFGDLFNMMSGARDMLNGDYLNGMIRVMPEVIKTPLEAYRLGTRGFISNLTGQKMPLTAGAYDIVLTLLAIDPAKEAEYAEVARDAVGLKTMRQLNSSNIVRHMEMAYMSGDQGMMNTWMAEAQKWQRDHPGLVPPQLGFQRELENHLRQSTYSRGVGLPLGISPRDIGERGMLRYSNFPVQ